MLRIPKVTIGVLTYNHENYIRECLHSLVNQIGNFELKIVIHDDCSSDRTKEEIQSFLKNVVCSERLQIVYHRHTKNLGRSGLNNLASLVAEMKGSDYFCLIDGDDYYSSFLRIALHLQLHSKNPDLSFSYNCLQFQYQSTGDFENYHPEFDQEYAETEDLIKENFIGNLGCVFYNSRFLEQLPDNLFEVACYDWFFNTYYSQFGKVQRLNQALNIYRKHEQGLWSHLSSTNRLRLLIDYIDDYNRFLNYRYDSSYCLLRERLREDYEIDLLIIDDFFPSPHSGFRLQELTSIMEAIPEARVLARGRGVSFFGKQTVEELVSNFKVDHSVLDRQLQTNAFYNAKVKLLYINFITTAYALIIEDNYQIPFVLTIYPGGGFALNSAEVDERMRLIFSSPYFRRVIVTQQVIYDYLVEHQFCSADQIEFVFGVVTPLAALNQSYQNKQHFGLDKEILDICFVAHKYTQFGQDKGYDTFIEVAHRLAVKFNNINFHVVGPWNAEVIDVSKLKGRLTFYGAQDQSWFDTFFIDKDIILSPNIPDQIYPGSFDGFPTGCATDAALREVALFCSDPLELNQQRFKDDSEIVIISTQPDEIVSRIEQYYKQPQKLKQLAQQGAKRVKQLYSYEAQIAPRLKILREEIAKSSIRHSTLPVARIEPVRQVNESPSVTAVVITAPQVSLRRKIIRKSITSIRLLLKCEYIELYHRFWFNTEKVVNRYNAKLKSKSSFNVR